MPGGQVLLLEHDAASRELITSALGAAGERVIAVEDAPAALAQVSRADVVVLGTVQEPLAAADLCRQLRASSASVPILAIAATDELEDRVALLEAGADDVVGRPFDIREVEAQIEALLVRARGGDTGSAAYRQTGSPGGLGRVIACFSPKGGVGTTTVAVNIAAAAAEQQRDRTAILDLDLQWGQVATYLNLRTGNTIADLARDETALFDAEGYQGYGSRHSGGLVVFAAPLRPDEAELVDGERVRLLTEGAANAYETVIVDCGSSLDVRTLSVFQLAQTVLVVVAPDIATLGAVRGLRDLLAESGGLEGKLSYVLNHIYPRDLISTQDVENALGGSIEIELPYDQQAYAKAANEGVPLIISGPKTKAAERLRELATRLVAEEAASEQGSPKKRGLFRRG